MWSLRSDSNRRPAHYECAALPTELPRQPRRRVSERGPPAPTTVSQCRPGALGRISATSCSEGASEPRTRGATTLQHPCKASGPQWPVPAGVLALNRGGVGSGGTCAMESRPGREATVDRLEAIQRSRAAPGPSSSRWLGRRSGSCSRGEVPVRPGGLGRGSFLVLSSTLATVADIFGFRIALVQGDKPSQARRRQADRRGEGRGKAHPCRRRRRWQPS